MYTVAIKNKCFGVILELYVVSESRANVGLSIGYVTANTLRGLSAVLKAGCIAVSYVILEGVTESRAGVSHGVGCVTARTLRGLSTVSKTGCVAVGTIVVEGVTESLTVFYATYLTYGESGTGSCATGMTESIKVYGVARELSATIHTVNYVIVATVIYTVGIDVVFYNYSAFGMTESLNSYVDTRELGGTNSTVNYVVIATVVYTVGRDDVLDNYRAFGVTESINSYVDTRELDGTNSTVNYVIIAAGVNAIGRDNVFYNYRAFGVTESVNYNVLGVEYLITYGTTYYEIVATVVYTVGENLVLIVALAGGMTESRYNDVGALKLLGAVTTVNYAVIVTVINTVRSNNVLRNGIERVVTDSGIDNVYTRELGGADLTVNYLVMITVYYTGRGHDVLVNRSRGSVAVRFNKFIYVYATASTCVSGKATLGTCRSGNNIYVVMLSSSYNVAACEFVTVLVDSYYLEGVRNLLVTVSGNLETTDAVVCCDRVGNVFIIAIYGVLISAIYLVPRELYLAAFLVGSGYCDGQITFAGQSVNTLSARGKSHSAGESNYESKHGYERANLSE